MCLIVRSSADPGSVAQKCAHLVISGDNPGSLTRKCTHLIEAEDDDDIGVKWSRDGMILTNLEPKVRARAVRQAEDLLGKSKNSCILLIKRVQERAMETESSSSSSLADEFTSQENMVRLVC